MTENFRKILRYVAYWPWFVGSVIMCLILAWGYLNWVHPVYEMSASVLIKEGNKKGGGASAGALAAVQDLGILSMTSNFDNEIEKLKSRTLVQQVVDELGLYISMEKRISFGRSVPVYGNGPLKVFLSPEEADGLEGPVRLELSGFASGEVEVQAEYVMNQEQHVLEQRLDKLPGVLVTPVGLISIRKGEEMGNSELPFRLSVVIQQPVQTALAYGANLSVTPVSKKTTIAAIRVKDVVRERGMDFIRGLVACYNRDANEEKNEVAEKTAEFIRERVAIIHRELGSTESRLANFKQKSGLTNLTSDAQLALAENSKYEQQRTELATQINLVRFLSNYIFDPANREEVLPANVGLKDAGLASVIDQYNVLVIERKRLLRTSSETNPAVIQLNAGIEAMRKNVQTSVSSVLKGLEIARGDIERQATKFEDRISKAPKQEKELMHMARQQEIQSALYSMLLEKREQNALTLAATAANGRIIEEPMGGQLPVSPKGWMVYLVACLAGVALPFGGVTLVDLVRYRIEGRADVEAITQLPLIGEIPLSLVKSQEGAVVVREHANEMMEEAFRAFRTNLLFMLKPAEQVILFTSTQPGEGKSFMAGNFAASLAFLGKKVLVVGADIRKPGLNRVFHLGHQGRGLTEFLADPEHTDLFGLIQPSDVSENLDILIGGVIPPNPTELVARESLEVGMNQLKERYDYIVLDSAPIAMVTDTMILARVADLCVYVCRADVTPKDGVAYANTLAGESQFPKMAVALNGIDLRKWKHRYGTGYGKYGSYC